MLRPTLLITLLAALAVPAGAGAAGPPRPLPLDSGWTFAVDGQAPKPVSVPHVMQPNPTPASFPGTTGTYRVSFTPPRLPDGFAWALRFEQVRRVARIELNGVTIGVHKDPYVPFTLPAQSLRPGVPNELVVHVDNRKGPEPREGWWNWGGITRPVSLVAQGPVVLDGLGLLPHVACDKSGRCRDAQVLVDGWLTNRTPVPTRPTVSVRLTSPRSHAVTRAVIAGPMLAPGQTARVRARLHVAGHPETWSPDSPARYQADVQTRDGTGRLVQVDRPKIGLRQVIVRHGHLLLNGRRLELRGASVQEDVPGRGPALTDRDIDGIVSDLRAVHANVTRAHYLLTERLLDRLDAAGILVWTQAPIFHRDVLLRSPGGRANALGTLRNTILAARNHPSTLLYSVANELNATPMRMPSTQAYLLAAARETRDLDPTRPVGVDVLAYPSLPFDPTYRAFDALGVNSYFGWYPGKKARPTGAIEETAPYLRRWHDRYRRQALVLTEFGAEATKDGPASEKQTFAFQADYLQRMLKAVAASPADGAIYWTLREFAVKPFWDGLTNGTPRPDVAVDSIHNKGLISYRGARKPAWSVAAKDFAATPLFPGALPPRAARRALPPAGSDLPGAVLVALCLLGLLGTSWLSLRSFLILRAARSERLAVAAAANVVPLRREADGDHVTVGHDVVAAFEA